jgi:indole-3-glycerol phosphate synthase
MATHLESILSAVREALESRKASEPFAGVAERAKRNVLRRGIRLVPGDPPGIIAEIKRASPSRGWIRKELDAADTARAYVRGGACAVSVLTEGRFFGGSLADLSAASAACGDVPALRKDFLLDDYMIAESRAHGADFVLLIVAVLGKETGRMLRSARAFGMEALVEVHDEAEMELAAEAGASVIGINNRNLATLEVDLDTSRRLLPLAPEGAVKVVESGIASPEEVRRLHALGADAFLVGEALVRAGDPENAVRTIRENTSRRTA